jgi:dienelactone hydrolase
MTHSQPQGFLAVPPTGKGSGVLVLHAWWGLNDTMRAFCTRLAEAGFVAFAPDLYHGKVTDTIAGAETLSDALTGHWFFEPDRPQAYNQAAASLAWERTLAFLAQNMAP